MRSSGVQKSLCFKGEGLNNLQLLLVFICKGVPNFSVIMDSYRSDAKMSRFRRTWVAEVRFWHLQAL